MSIDEDSSNSTADPANPGRNKSTIIERLTEGKFTLIAEIGVNYYDIARERSITPMEAAKQMIKEAVDAGIHAVKFQSYKAGTLAAKASPYYWDINEEPTTTQYELFRKFDSFGEKEYRELDTHTNTCADGTGEVDMDNEVISEHFMATGK